MRSFCQDRDILGIEPIVYLGGGFPVGQKLITGEGGSLVGNQFIAANYNFQNRSIEPGMVLCTTKTIASEGAAFEILGIENETTLIVSVLRPSLDDTAIPPSPETGLSFYVCSFANRIASVSSSLAEKMRTLSEAAGIAQADFADSTQLRTTTAYGVLAGLFLAQADNARPHDANWIKADYYRQEFIRAQNQLRLAVDGDANGTAERTRTLGNVLLKRV